MSTWTRAAWSKKRVRHPASSGVITFVLHPQAAALQAQTFASKGDEARKAAFEAFFQLHKPVRVLYIVNVGLGIALLTVRVRSWISR